MCFFQFRVWGAEASPGSSGHKLVHHPAYDTLTAQTHAHTHTHGDRAIWIHQFTSSASLGCGRKPKYSEKTQQDLGELANSTQRMVPAGNVVIFFFFFSSTL